MVQSTMEYESLMYVYAMSLESSCATCCLGDACNEMALMPPVLIADFSGAQDTRNIWTMQIMLTLTALLVFI